MCAVTGFPTYWLVSLVEQKHRQSSFLSFGGVTAMLVIRYRAGADASGKLQYLQRGPFVSGAVKGGGEWPQ